MTPAEIIAEARILLQDTRATYRYSDTILLGFVNQSLRRMAVVRPDLFGVITNFTLSAGTVLQSCPADSVRLVEIFQVVGGNAVTEVSRETMDQSTPGWVSEDAGSPVNYVRHPRNPNKFFVYPRPSAGVQLVGEYVQSPPNYTINQSISLPDAYYSTLIDGVVFLAESIDNEHVNTGRAKLFQDSFYQGLGVAQQQRVVTDTESGAVDRKVGR
jgi:hypothetical protein